ncbi:MAG: cytochrome c oxidase subunit 3 [Verrucomicrobia bacterium]|nr:cytochrome c oxidase subunit 3 [Verrucomicrobiota bacterium]
METVQTIERTEAFESPWAGGVSPFKTSWQKLMMWLFIIGDALLFAGFLAIYGFVRLASPSWPNRAEVFHLELIALMTTALISSGATMATAVEAARRGHWRMVVRFLLLTLAGGLAFLGMQAYEWSQFIAAGATLQSNPWGVPPFGASFFLITGFHGAHVSIGIVILLITAVRSATGRSRAGGLELAGLYWAFVDLVWVFIFPLFYLI